MNINSKSVCPLKTKNQLKRKSSFQPACLNACFSFPNWNNAWIRLGCTDIDQKNFKCVYLHTWQYHLNALYLNVQIIVSSTTLSFLVELCEQKKKRNCLKEKLCGHTNAAWSLTLVKFCPLFPSLNKNFQQNKLQKWINFTTRDIYFDQIYSLQRTKSPLSL